MDNSDFVLYGGAIVAGALVIFLGYRLFYRKGGTKPKSHVADSINDFYATQDKQDKQDKHQDDQQNDSSDSSSGGDSSGD
ncbi:MAG: hypothetical protein UW27_C0002G0059 [Parcubacteria group bacterium GW2011_GWA1_44_13]|uniref:Uncharacterized protein n=1 Tax=Candidatus Nomurabacteria bacterium GW2011_GWB1_44_12 TaxID=1618748 RepID=A0A837I840_9BACT|nr:MAG: hypothetical protein UW17_C0014G0002 [Candidatus Nomurabacteria bacterium GW2011_GWD1_44_10]KKT37115.1 MAG: hypothetical protein UW25_C0002G0061 [Candidatus Nomurabacteria bacterium GW2011_GWB1_44_12]KKT38409.1 MAG: hypothetical protein UW27_C0002G0059 [Parcubacteria group bacterium GW2011_GWA1_44_13]KKT60763.1 MAG: hypothetical protein UW54_C0004G0025 [Parcubacteria group bacterium GW2011_GWC1_44_26]HBB43803.1 hypothetical protein [Candidatus Yonathbacteria bacterium]